MNQITGPINAKVKEYNGKPSIFINETPVAPVMYALTDTPGGRWSWEELPSRQIKLFSEQGFNLFKVQIWLEDIWEKGKPLNIELVQKQLKGVININPNACIMLRFHINAPFWWNNENPDECTEFCDGEAAPHDENIGVRRYIIGDLDKRKLHSLASVKWREETAVVLKEFCQRLSLTKEAERLFSIQFCDGVSHEWHYWGFMKHEPDCGKAMTSYFRNWLKNEYITTEKLQSAWNDPAVTFENAEVPGMEWRQNWKNDVFKDVVQDKRIIDYYQAQQLTVAEDIIYFAQLFKENWPRELVIGVFYGYYYTMFFRQAVGGHLLVEKVLDCPYIDFLSAPFSYYGGARDVGGTGQARGLVEACTIRNKLWFNEQDQETQIKQIAIIKNNSIWDSEVVKDFIDNKIPEDVSLIRRNALQPFTKNNGFWYFDFGPLFNCGWWDYPDYMQTIGALKSFADSHLHKVIPSNKRNLADILVVYDTDSYYYVNQGWSPIAESADEISSAMYKTGVIFDNAYLFDLDKLDLNRYKAIFFANTWRLTEQQRALIKEKVARNGRHLIWNYMPGYVDERFAKADNTCDITGFQINEIQCGVQPKVQLLSNEETSLRMNCDGMFPFPVIEDPAAEVLGVGKEGALFAKKQMGSHVSWYSSVLMSDANVLRSIFKEAGAHVYLETGETLFGGEGILVFHSGTPGEKTVLLRDGKELKFEIDGPATKVIEL